MVTYGYMFRSDFEPLLDYMTMLTNLAVTSGLFTPPADHSL